jgi:hypothetical protein
VSLIGIEKREFTDGLHTYLGSIEMRHFWKRGSLNRCHAAESSSVQRWSAARPSVALRAVCLCCLVCLRWSVAGGAESIKRDSLFATQEVVPPAVWRETSSQEKWRVVALLADHMQANYARIRSWKGIYRVRAAEGQRESYMKEAFGDRVALRDVSKVGLERAFSVSFVIDLPGQRIYRAKQTDVMYWRDGKTDKQFNVPKTAPADERSFVAGEEYVHFDPVTTWPEFSYLPNHPDAMQKRAAFREPAEAGTRKHYGDLLDPRAFFGYNQNSRLWETLTFCLDSHNGKTGAGDKAKAEQSVRVFEADGNAGKLYRFNVETPGPQPGEPAFHTSLVFHGNIGFHPTEYLLRRGSDQKVQEIQWRWKSVDGIYLPEAVLEVFTAAGGQSLQLWRESELIECSVNVPLDENQFSVQGIGLKEGELVVDKIDRVVEIVRDGKMVRLGAFGGQYVAPPREVEQSAIRITLLGVSLLLLIAALVWATRRRKSVAKP